MCGLFGMAGPGIIAKDYKILADIALVSQLRGLDATGIFQVSGHQMDKYRLVKSPDDWNYFYWYHQAHEKGCKEILSDINARVVLGHVRHATRGAKNNTNCHPFEFPNLAGAHNGTLVSKEYQHESKTDSELLYKNISEKGPQDTLSELYDDDAYALTWFDKDQKKLFLTRNTGRTLYITVLKSRGVLYWASEGWMLDVILARHGEKHIGNDIENKSVITAEFCLLSVNPNQIRANQPFMWTREDYKGKGPFRRTIISQFSEFTDQEWDLWWKRKPSTESKREEKVEEVSQKEQPGKSVMASLLSTCECGKVMKPIDRYYGTEVQQEDISDSEYLCEDCSKQLAQKETEDA